MPQITPAADLPADDSPPPAPRRRPRRLVLWIVLAGLAVALLAAGTMMAHAQPLERGSFWAQPTSSTDAWQVRYAGPAAPSGDIVVARNKPGAHLDFGVTIRNRGPVAVAILDPDRALASWGAQQSVCGWKPRSAVFRTTAEHDEPLQKLTPPFDLDPGQEVMLDLAGTIGDPQEEACTKKHRPGEKRHIVLSLEAPLRFSLLGITRTQTVTLRATVGLSDEPEEWLTPDVTKVKPR